MKEKRKPKRSDAKEMCNGMEKLPNDLIEEILQRVDDVLYLLRCKSVSKQWNSLIKSTCFVSRHLIRGKSRNPQVLLGGSMYQAEDGSQLYSYLTTLLLDTSEAIIIPFFSEHVRSRAITGSCDGLVCVYDFHKDLYVINSATRWYRSLPRAKIQQIDGIEEILDRIESTQNLLGFGKDTTTGEHKMVWLYNSLELGLDGDTTCEVFEFSTNTWRHVTGSPHRICDENFNCGPVYLDGSLHWFTVQVDGKTKIIDFDLHTEVFQVMPEIPIVHASPQDIIMCSLNNRLCISEKKINSQEIWSLNSHKEWEKTCHINLGITSHYLDESYILPIPITPVTFFNETELLLHYGRQGSNYGRQGFETGYDYEPCLVIEDSGEGSYRLYGRTNYMDKAISYIPSLISI